MSMRISKRCIAAITLMLVAVIGVTSLAFLTDRVDHSMQFTTAKFTAEGYTLTRTAPVGPFCAGEDVTATLKESNTGEDTVSSVISMKAAWVSPDDSLSIFGNAKAEDNAKLSIGGTNISYKVSSDKKSVTFDLPAHVLAAGAMDAARDLTLTIPEAFKSTGRIDFTFEKVVVAQDGGGFSKEFSRTDLNASSKLDYSVRVGWAASSIANQNGKALMGYLTDKNSSGKYGIEFEFAFNYNTSPMKDFASKTDAKWSYYKDKADRLTFVEGMTSIGNYAFPGFSAVESVSFPSTVKTIGVSAFDASGLTGTVTIPATVKEIKSLAFGNLPNVKTFTFGHTTDSLTLPDNTAAGKRNAGAFYVPTHVDTTVNSSVESILYGYKWHDGYDNRREIPTLKEQDTWFRTYTSGSDYTANLDEDTLETITFADYHMPVTGETSWDASDPSVPGTVTAFLSADKKSLILAGNGYGLIFANEDSSQAFSNLTALKTVSDTDLLDTRNATTMAAMFNYDPELANISVTTWNVSKVTNMGDMFYCCDSLPSMDLKPNTCTAKDGSGQYTAWNTAALKYTSGMFMDYGGKKHALTTVDTTGWDTSKLEDASYMFMECQGLTKVKGIENWDVSSLKDTHNMFQDCQGLQTINVANWKTTSLENTNVMFGSCEALKSIDISKWDMSKVASSTAMFVYCKSFTELTLPKSLVVIGERFAGYCPKLTTITFNHPAGTNIQFGGDAFVVNDNGKSEKETGYVQYTPVAPLGTKVVTTNQDVLDYNWTSDHRGYKVEIKNVEGGTLTGAPLAAYNGSKAVVAINGKTVTFTPAVANAYNGATVQYSQGGTTKTVMLDKNTKTWIIPVVDDKVTEADIIVTPKWKKPVLAAKNTWYKGTVAKSAITGIEIMDSYNGTSVQSWDASAAQDGSVTAYLLSDNKLIIAGIGAGKVIANADSTGAFSGFWNAASFTGLNLLDTSNVTNMSSMFSYAKVLTDLDVSKFNTSKVTDMSSMFEGCYAVTGLPVGDFNTSKVTNMDRVFTECKALTSLDVSGWNTSAVTTMSGTFSYCGALTNDLNLTGWDTSKVKNMNGMFRYCKKLTSLDLSGFNTAQVTDMGYMFESCSTLPSVDVSKFNTAKVTNMEAMFSACDGLTSLNLSGFNTAQVTDMSNMFGACANLTSVNVSSFDTSRVTDMENMFSCCYKLASLDVSQFNTAQVTKMGGLFDRCYNLTSLNLGGWDTAKVTSMRNMFNGCRTLQTIKLSKDFKFVGTDGYLPKPDSAYIPRATGNWYIVGLGNTPCYTPAQLAAVVRVRAVTYTAIPIEIPGGGDDRTEFDVDWPKQIGKLIYNGSAQSPSWDGYIPAKMTMGGDNSGINADTYTATFKPKDGYCWPDGTADTVSVTWKIGKAAGSLSLSKYSDTISYNDTTATFTATRAGSGVISATSSDTKVATVSVSGDTVTVTKKTAGAVNITVSVAESTNYTAPEDKVCAITCKTIPVLEWQGKWYKGTTDEKKAITQIEIVDTYSGGATKSWDASAAQDGSVMAYINGTKLTIAGNGYGRILANTNSQYAFEGFYKVTSITGLDKLDTSKATNISNMFYNCGALASLDVSKFDTSNVTNMKSMFYNCGDLASLDVSGWNTSKVRDMSEMFMFCYDLTDLDVSNFNTSNVTNMKSMFHMCNKLTRLNVSEWNTGRVTNMSLLFYGCEALTGVDLSGWNTSKVTDMSGMFSGCKAITSLDLRNFNTAKVKNMKNMFYQCLELKTLELSSFDTSSVTNMSEMFLYCNKLQTVTLGKDFKFVGTDGYLPEPSSTYISGATGEWYDTTDGAGYTPAELAGVTRTETRTYVAIPNTEKILVPEQLGTLTYNGGVQEPVWSGYDPAKMTLGGTTSGTNAGSYTATFTPKTNYKWSDGTTAAKSVTWKIGKAAGSLTLSTFSATIYDPTTTFTVTRAGDGAISVESSAPAVATATVSGNTVTVTKKGTGTATITVSVAEGTNYTAPADKTCTVTCKPIPVLAEGSTWYKGTTAKSTITQMELIDSGKPSGTISESWDASAAQDGSVMAYIVGTKLTLSGNGYGKIMANAKSHHAFSQFTALTDIAGMKKLDTSNVTNMWVMFGDCNALTSLDVSNFDTSNVTTMNGMFVRCNALTSLDLSNWDVSKVRIMGAMFFGCNALTSVGDLSGWNTASLTDLLHMFVSCDALTSLNLAGWDTSKVTSMSGMFSGCDALTSLDLSGWSTASVNVSEEGLDTMNDMFEECNKLQTVTLGKDFKFVGTKGYLPTPSSTYISGADGKWYDAAVGTGYTPAELAGVTRTEDRTYVAKSITTLAAQNTWYKGTTAKSTITQIELVDSGKPSGTISESWDASAAQDGSVMAYIVGTKLTLSGNGYGKIMANAKSNTAFRSFTALTSITGLEILDTSMTTNMAFMFGSCGKLTNLDLSTFDTSAVTATTYMFSGCSSLTDLNLSNWDTSNVTTMAGMFGQCSNLTSLDLSGWNTAKATYMSSMFFSCKNLQKIYVSDLWTTASVTSSDGMFDGCVSLSGKIAYDASKTDAAYANYTNGYLTYKAAPTK